MRHRRASAPRWLLILALLLALLTPAETALAAAQPSGRPFAPIAASGPADGFTAVTGAIVRADGEGLRLRATPSIGGTVLATLADGTAVTILAGRVSADGYWWQHVQAGTRSGWVAEMYLASTPAATPAPSATATAATTRATAAQGPGCPASTPASAAQPTAPVHFGTVPKAGFGLVVWNGGGDAEAVAAVAADGGCRLASVWVIGAEGQFLGYLYGAPAFVNQGWADHFPAGIPGATPLILLCGGPSSPAGLSSASTTSSLIGAGLPAAVAPLAAATDIVPAPWGQPPAVARSLVPPAIDATAAVVLDGSSGAVMYEKNGHQSLPPASLTKIATAILTVEAGGLNAWVPVDVDSNDLPGSSVMGLHRGDCFRVRDLLYGLMLPSGNDAALALARFEAGSDDAFVGRMNALATRLHLTETHFVNPHGLSEPGHLSSAHDLALLARYAMTLPDLTAVVGATSWKASGSRTISLTNINTFLSDYSGADGVKTGFTEEAGRTLVASVTRNGRRVFVVVLNAPDRDADAAKLFDWAFANFVWG
jgi:D-alanyl-D-alanine carboxypeptidase